MPGMSGICSSPYQQKQQKELLNQFKQSQTINGTENKCGSQLFDRNLKKETNGKNKEEDIVQYIKPTQKQIRPGLKDEERVQEYNGGQVTLMSANQMNQSSSALIEQTLQNRINEFMDVTQSTPEQAEWYLKQNNYNVEKAVEQYFDQVEQQKQQNQNKQLHQTRQTQQVVQRQTQVENRSIQQSKEPKYNQQINKFMEITGMPEQQAQKYLLQQNYNLDKALDQFYDNQPLNDQENTKQSIINQKQLSNAVSQEYDKTQQKEEINNDSEISPQKKSENTFQQENRNNLSQYNKKQNSKIINQNQHDYEKQQSVKTDFQEVLLPAGPDFQHLLKQNNQNSQAQNQNQVLAQNNGFSNQIFNSSNAVQNQNIPHQFQSNYQTPQSQYQQSAPFINTQQMQQPSSNFSSIPQTNQFDQNALNHNQNNFISTQNPVSNAFNHVQNQSNAFNPAFSISNQNSGFAPITNAAFAPSNQFASSAFNPSSTFNATQNPQNLNQNIANTLPQSTKINIITLKAEHMKQFTAQIIEFLNKYAQNATVKTNQSGDLNIYTNEREIETVIQVVRKIVVEEEQIPFTVVVV
ncbi:UBA-like_superfamily [Hexamita inflata]|uniref:UBA-like superfamily n=1 Tax=Hexamita inflata TaxID=28002 RepID=A0AA86R7V5_9EUKA|nr:UBA-like superfamily [Hexamita inflata]